MPSSTRAHLERSQPRCVWRRLGRAWLRLEGVLVMLGLTACTGEPRQQSISHGRFQQLSLTVPRSPDKLVLLLAGAGASAPANALGHELARGGAIVTRIDADALRSVLVAPTERCALPSGDLDNLAHFVQAYLTLPSYQPAILVGLGSGAGLATTALLQSPPGTFAGAIAFDFCGDSSLGKAPCAAPGLQVDDTSQRVAPTPALADPLLRLRSPGAAAACPAGSPPEYSSPMQEASALPRAIEALAATAHSRALAPPAALADLPTVEVAASTAEHPDVFAVLLSGDGGWAGIDKDLSTRLAERGLPVVGVDSLRYFWRPRTPESTAADVERIIRHYQAAWRRSRVLLIGYSQGADVLPFVLNRLPEQTRVSLVASVALSLSASAAFEFHVSNWIGASGDRPTAPELERLAPGALTCVAGKEDADAICSQLDPARFRLLELPGSHHFDGDYERLSSIVLETLGPGE
jgi:type IV secretory pathway VirJ component